MDIHLAETERAMNSEKKGAAERMDCRGIVNILLTQILFVMLRTIREI